MLDLEADVFWVAAVQAHQQAAQGSHLGSLEVVAVAGPPEGMAVQVLMELSDSHGEKMKKWAVIEQGMIINIILWNGVDSWEPEIGQHIVELPNSSGEDQQPGIGWFFSEGVFTPPIEDRG